MPVDRSAPPAVGPDPAFAFPAIARHRLPNGLDVRVVQHGTLPVVSCSLLVSAGSAADPRGKEGLSALLADMVDEGTGALDAIQVSEALAGIGADYDVDVGADSMSFSVTVLAKFAGEGIRLLADMTTRPRLFDPDFQRVRQLRRDRVRQMRDVPSAVAERVFLRAVYGEHPYGHQPIGTDESLSGLTLDEAVAAHWTLVRPATSALVVAGGLPPEHLLSLAEDAFGGWGFERSSAGQPSLGDPLPLAPRLILAHRPGAAQSELRIGRLVAPRRTPDYFPLLVMNAVLGGQFVSRLNLKLREEKGFTYGARTGFDWHVGVSPCAMYASVHTAATAEAIADTMRELEDLRAARPVTADELQLAKASLTRGYPQHFQTVPQVARSVGQLAIHELPDSYFSDFIPRVQAVTQDDVARVATQYLDSGQWHIVVVGDRDVVAAPLTALGLRPLEVETV